jgi:putative ABC transport system permease protein
VHTDPGFDSHDLLTVGLSLPDTRYPDDDDLRRFYRELMPKLEALPGVKDAAFVMPLPFSEANIGLKFDLDDRPPAPDAQPFVAGMRFASPGYFKMMKVPLLQGRSFSAADDTDKAPHVIIISESFAKTYWPTGNPIGRHIKVGLRDDKPREIVGVVGDVHIALDQKPRPDMYVPFGQQPFPFGFAVVRAKSPTSLLGAVRAEVMSIDKDQPLSDAKTMDELIGASLAQRRVNLLLLGIFSLLALVLAAVGIYGVMSYVVTQRTRELGIRIALGAAHGRVLGMVVGQSLRLAAIGIGIGLVGALALSRVIASLLYGVSALDPPTFAGIAILLAIVCTVASFLPAWRATRVDPMVALREE